MLRTEFAPVIERPRDGLLVFDCDGTLCSIKGNKVPSPSLCRGLERLPEHGLEIAFITGRPTQTIRGCFERPVTVYGLQGRAVHRANEPRATLQPGIAEAMPLIRQFVKDHFGIDFQQIPLGQNEAVAVRIGPKKYSVLLRNKGPECVFHWAGLATRDPDSARVVTAHFLEVGGNAKGAGLGSQSHNNAQGFTAPGAEKYNKIFSINDACQRKAESLDGRAPAAVGYFGDDKADAQVLEELKRLAAAGRIVKSVGMGVFQATAPATTHEALRANSPFPLLQGQRAVEGFVKWLGRQLDA